MINSIVALTTADCVHEHGGEPRSFVLAQGMYDERVYREHNNHRLGHAHFKYVQFKVVDNAQKIYSDLVLIRLKRAMISSIPPLQIAPFVIQPENPDQECRVYGWAVWGPIQKNHPAYQMFSVPVQIIDNKHCAFSYDHDLCIAHDETICPQKANGAPVVCRKNGKDFLVGLAKSNPDGKRSNPIAVANVNQYNFDIGTFIKTSFEFRAEENVTNTEGLASIHRMNPLIIFIAHISKHVLKC